MVRGAAILEHGPARAAVGVIMFNRSTVVGAALILVASTPLALAANRVVTINNKSSYQIQEFYASNSGTNEWEEDILGVDVLAPGESVDVDIDDGTGYCKFDFRAVFVDGDEAVKTNVNVCEISEFDFTN